MNSPALFVLIALVAYGIAYFGYGRWFDRTVWKPDPKRTTPAHMYTDGVEYFPVSKYVLWGYQFKSIAALGPVLGPYIAINYGWAPALAWIILGNFFIGWLQDYGAIMLSVRNQGRSFGPITYEFTGNAGRNTLLGFILFYLLIISATFIYFIALFWHIFPSTFATTIGILLVGVLAGQMLYKLRINVLTTTLVALGLMALVIWAAAAFPALQTPAGAWPPDPAGGVQAGGIAGEWSLLVWGVVVCVILYLASVLPLPTFIQPVNYVSFFPTFLAVILILVGALVSGFTGVRLEQPAWIGFNPTGNNPMWPLMFVAIACGSISGWHSLVSSSSTSKQLDVETDALPVGAGAMLSEGLLALASLAAYMIIPKDQLTGSVGAWVAGAIKFTQPFLGAAATDFLKAYFGVVLILYALTVQTLVTRFWRLVSAEVFRGPLAILGQKHVATFVGLVIPLAFAATGSWNNLWLYFGGSNQLLAGLALMLITIHLARTKAPTIYTLLPATFMIITTISAIAWQAVRVYLPAFLGTTPTLVQYPFNQYSGFARAMDGIFVLVGAALFILGLTMAYRTYAAYAAARRAPVPTGDD